MLAAHLSNSTFDDVCGWSLRQTMGVVRRGESVLPLINPFAQGKVEKSKPVTNPDAIRMVAKIYGLER